MEKLRRVERVAALTKLLTDMPGHLFSLGSFSQTFGAAKSTLSEDMVTIRQALNALGMGTLETVPGAAGGVRYLPNYSAARRQEVLDELAVKLAEPERIIPGGFLYMTDLLFQADRMARIGEVFRTQFAQLQPDYIMTVETKGIPLALMTARAFGLPLVTARRGSKVTEGSSVNINYVSGSSKRIQTMSLPRRAIEPGGKVLIVDDFMKAGGTARGMADLAQEVGGRVVGIGVLVATVEPEEKLVEDYLALLTLHAVNQQTREIDIRPLAMEQETDAAI